MNINSQRKFLNALFAIAFVVLAFSVISAYHYIHKALNSNSWVIHTYDVISVTNQLNILLTDIESRTTFYVISHDKQSVQNYSTINYKINEMLVSLKNLTRDNQEQHERLIKIEPLIQEKINLNSQIVNTSDNNQALMLASSKKRIALKEEITSMMTAITNEEFNLLNLRSEAYQNNIDDTINELFYSVIVAGSIFLVNFLILNYQLKNLKESDKLLKVMNTKLRESEERNQLATEGSGVGLWDWKPDTEDVYYSPHFKKMLGFNDDEFPDALQSFEKHVHAEDHAKVWEMVNLHLGKRIPYKIEYRLRNKFCQYKWFQAAGQAIWDDSGKPIRMLGTIIDINDKKIAEIRLDAQYEIIRILSSEIDFDDVFAKVMQAIQKIVAWDVAAIWLTNEETDSLKCSAFFRTDNKSNDIYENVTRQLSLTLGAGLTGQVYQSSKPMFIQNLAEDKQFTRKQEAIKVGLRSGYFVPILMKKSIYGVIEMLTYKQAESDESLLNMLFYIGCLIGEYIKRQHTVNELRKSEIYKTAILDSALEGIVTTDENGIIQSCNRQTNRMFHYENEGLISENIDFLLPNLNEKFHSLIDKKYFEWKAKYNNGKYFPAEVSISQIALNKVFYVLIIRDISEQKRIANMKNEFISLVSHELRTPLTSIQGSIDLILDGTVGEVNPDVKQLISIAQQNSERLIRLINDILDIEKIESGKMDFKLQVMDIYLVVEESIKFNQAYAEKHSVHIRNVNKSGSTYVNVDHDRLIQVLTNLLSNAIKFTPKGESVDVSITQIDKKVRVKVTDKGPGISKEFQSRLFQKFAQEDSSNTRAKEGTGLGLSISKAIIENMHGKINYITSDKGASFYFDLPVTIQLNNLNDSIQLTDTQSINILLIENDIDLAQVLHKMLQEEGNLHSVNSKQAAIDSLSKYHFNLVILDLLLPDGSGTDLIQDIHNKNIPIIVYSAYELPKKYQSYVEHVLIKSQTSNKKIIDIVKSILKIYQ